MEISLVDLIIIYVYLILILKISCIGRVGGCKYYTSSDLQVLWPYGYSAIGDLTFESAAYVARYCTKKITGKIADDYYQGKSCEFPLMSLETRYWF